MTSLDHARRQLLTDNQKRDYDRWRDGRDEIEWIDDRDAALVDEQLDIPLPEPEPLQRDLFK